MAARVDPHARQDAASLATRLHNHGFVVQPDRCESRHAAWEAAEAVIRTASAEGALCQQLGSPAVVADYTMPPADVSQRAFQVLHLNFGLSLGLAARTDVARYTALHVDASATGSGTATRIVPLAALAPQRTWPGSLDLAARLRTREGDPDAAEGVLARIIEAVDGTTELPQKTDASFQCGLEFDTVEAERRYFLAHDIDLSAAEQHVILQPGQCLIFDNLHCAHGRQGVRAAAELHQRCLGFVDVTTPKQATVLLAALDLLTGSTCSELRSRRSVTG